MEKRSSFWSLVIQYSQILSETQIQYFKYLTSSCINPDTKLPSLKLAHVHTCSFSLETNGSRTTDNVCAFIRPNHTHSHPTLLPTHGAHSWNIKNDNFIPGLWQFVPLASEKLQVFWPDTLKRLLPAQICWTLLNNTCSLYSPLSPFLLKSVLTHTTPVAPCLLPIFHYLTVVVFKYLRRNICGLERFNLLWQFLFLFLK